MRFLPGHRPRDLEIRPRRRDPWQERSVSLASNDLVTVDLRVAFVPPVLTFQLSEGLEMSNPVIERAVPVENDRVFYFRHICLKKGSFFCDPHDFKSEYFVFE